MACFGEDYQTKFESKIYLHKIYRELNVPLKDLLTACHEEFKKPDHKGGKMLEVGSGPCIHFALIGSNIYNEITLSDYTDSNRDEIVKWLSKDKDAFDWKQVSTFIGELENREPRMIIERARTAFKEVIPVDLTNDNIFHPNTRGKYDCVVSCLCLELSYKDLASYKNGFQKIAGYVTDGGLVILIGTLGESYYQFGSHRFHTLTVTKEDVENAVHEAGLVINEMKLIPQTGDSKFATVDYNSDAFYFLQAKKKFQ